MTDEVIISWLFLAIALASQIRPATFNEISQIADGINHAVPSHKELQNSIAWLMQNSLITKTENKYCLTDRGQEILGGAESQSNILSQIWNYLEKDILDIKNNL